MWKSSQRIPSGGSQAPDFSASPEGSGGCPHHLWALGINPAVQQTSVGDRGLERARPPTGPLGSSRRAGLVRPSVHYSQWLFQKNRSSTRPLMKTISSTKGGSTSPGSCGRNRQLLCVSCCSFGAGKVSLQRETLAINPNNLGA